MIRESNDGRAAGVPWGQVGYRELAWSRLILLEESSGVEWRAQPIDPCAHIAIVRVADREAQYPSGAIPEPIQFIPRRAHDA
jgi:hypothetical protein